MILTITCVVTLVITLILCICAYLIVVIAHRAIRRPEWYGNKEFGHRNQLPSVGLTSQPIGAAATLWRISESIDGLGDPKTTHGYSFTQLEIPLQRTLHPKTNQLLRGWHIPSKSSNDDDVCVIAVHGGGRDRRAFLRHLPVFYENNCSVVMFDLEEHGNSDGNQRGIGWLTYEADNVLSVVSYVKQAFDYRHIVLLGTSMGAAASLVASGYGKDHNNSSNAATSFIKSEKCPSEHISAVIAENAFTSRKDLMFHAVGKVVGGALGLQDSSSSVRHYIASTITKLVSYSSLWQLGDKHHANPVDAVRKINVPVLFMHGDDDDIVPHIHSEILYALATSSQKDLWILPRAIHTGLHNVAPEEWNAKVLGVVQRVRDSFKVRLE